MALWRLYYHLIWATKERQPLITCDRETQLYNYIIGKSDELGSIIHAIGGVENHIHLAQVRYINVTHPRNLQTSYKITGSINLILSV
jgi:REP element-mobilizing transposase RayT